MCPTDSAVQCAPIVLRVRDTQHCVSMRTVSKATTYFLTSNLTLAVLILRYLLPLASELASGAGKVKMLVKITILSLPV